MKAVSDVKMKKIIQTLLARLVFGKWPNFTTDTLFAVGNGTSDAERKNALEVRNNSIIVNGQELTKEEITSILNHLANPKANALINHSPDAIFNGKDVKMSYEYVPAKDISLSDTSIPFFTLPGNGEVIVKATGWWELQSLLQNYFYTESEVDAKLANIGSGGSAGMVREFDSGNINSAEWSFTGNQSKIYTILLRDDSEYRIPLTIDYRHLEQQSDGTRLGVFNVVTYNYDTPLNPAQNTTVIVEVTGSGSNKKVTFRVSEDRFKLWHICGYY